jgi:hypothetical protein
MKTEDLIELLVEDSRQWGMNSVQAVSSSVAKKRWNDASMAAPSSPSVIKTSFEVRDSSGHSSRCNTG